MLAQGQIAHRNEFIKHVFAEIQRIEQAAQIGSPGRASRYIDGGEWLIQPGFALACLMKRLRRPSHQPILAGVSVKKLVRLWQSYLRDATLQFDSSAAAVNIRRHNGGICVVRTFYPSGREPTTVKALVESPSGCAVLQAEIENRRIVEETGHLRAPKILAEDLDGRSPFVVEEFIAGRIAFRRKDQALLSQTLLPSLQQHYAAFGVSCESIETCFGIDVYDRVEHAAGLLPWDPQWRDRQQFLSVVRRLADSGKQLTLSFCHGDLSVSHVVVADDGRVFLLDWEQAGVRPIALDLIHLEKTCLIKQIKLYRDCERLLDELSPTDKSGDLFSPAEQLFLASLQRIFDWEKYRCSHLRRGKDHTVALKWQFDNANEILKYAHGFPVQNSMHLPAAQLACRRNGLVDSVLT